MKNFTIIILLTSLFINVNIYPQANIDTVMIDNADQFLKCCNIFNNDTPKDCAIIGAKNYFLVVEETDGKYIKTYYKMAYDSITQKNICIFLEQEEKKKKEEKSLCMLFDKEEFADYQSVYSTDSSFENMPYFFKNILLILPFIRVVKKHLNMLFLLCFLL